MESVLENVVSNFKSWPSQSYVTIDFYTEGYSRMYTGPSMPRIIHPVGGGMDFGGSPPMETQKSLHDYGFEKTSDFKKSSDFGIGGGGIARKIDDTSLIERFRYDVTHEPAHTNYEITIDTMAKRKPLITKHNQIDL